MLDLIIKKRNGNILSPAEIAGLVAGFVSGEIPDYQMAAWLMAVYFQGLNYEETVAMTIAMARSGKIMDLTSVPGVKVDKHSTGGVADTTTLIIAPLVAAAGVTVAKMSGRGLGFTGGTIDKLEAIPGFRTALEPVEFISLLNKHGIALTGQTADIAPADGKIYALRDVTGTVESIPLIAASIMSKKIAAGADKILLDVKVGCGAFMKTREDAVYLAKTMVNIGTLAGRQCRAVISNMDNPLGQAIGNSLEIREAIEVLRGGGSRQLRDFCLFLGTQMLLLAGKVASFEQGYRELGNLLGNGLALAKFKEFVTAQGGNPAVTDDLNLLPLAGTAVDIYSTGEGYIKRIDAGKLGQVSLILGAGREYKDQPVDLSAGILLKCKVGDYMAKGEIMATIFTNRVDKVEQARELVAEAIGWTSEVMTEPDLIVGIVDENGIFD